MRFWVMLFPLLFTFSLQAERQVTAFRSQGLSAWEVKSFVGETQYQLEQSEGQTILKAESNGTASALLRKQTIDLLATPYLNWSWRVDTPLPKLDESKKEGDDYAARIYLVIDGGMMFWRTLSLNYVWSGSQQPGSNWDNAYAGQNLQMLTLRGPLDQHGTWYFEKRNAYEDLIAFLGDKGSDAENIRHYRFIDAIAIMTDSDDSKTSAVAFYGDIHFSKD